MGRIEGLESQRCPGLLFHWAMVLLNNVVPVFALPNFYRRAALLVVSFDSSNVSTALIDVDFHGYTVVANRLA